MAFSRNVPDQPVQSLNQSIMLLTGHYAAFLDRAGVDRHSFEAWAVKNRADSLGSAMTRHAVSQDVRSYAALVREFKQSRGLR
jgi:hypothetical protein